MAKTLKIYIPPEVRKYVFERDRYQCQSCGKTQLETKLTIDHIIPLARGGQNDISNLQTLCFDCNQQKKHHLDPRFPLEFLPDEPEVEETSASNEIAQPESPLDDLRQMINQETQQ